MLQNLNSYDHNIKRWTCTVQCKTHCGAWHIKWSWLCIKANIKLINVIASLHSIFFPDSVLHLNSISESHTGNSNSVCSWACHYCLLTRVWLSTTECPCKHPWKCCFTCARGATHSGWLSKGLQWLSVLCERDFFWSCVWPCWWMHVLASFWHIWSFGASIVSCNVSFIALGV